MMTYSQYNIEPLLDEFLNEVGFFLEIGCWDGTNLSQSLYLEQKGWNGLCVDPFPKNFDGRRCSLCQKAISLDGGPRDFIQVGVDRRNGGDVSYLSGFLDSINFHYDTIEKYCDHSTIEVDTITIEQLYEQYNLPEHIDFLSVDVEGAEYEVFRGIDFSKYTFSMVMFEHNGSVETRRGIGTIMECNGYKRVPYLELKLDDLYISDGLLW